MKLNTILSILCLSSFWVNGQRVCDVKVLGTLALGLDKEVAVIYDECEDLTYKTIPVSCGFFKAGEIVRIYEEDIMFSVVKNDTYDKTFCTLTTKNINESEQSFPESLNRVERNKNTSPFDYCKNDPNPIGGGEGYNDIVDPLSADLIIDSFTSAIDFKDAIENEPAGSKIYITGNLVIDLTGLGNQIVLKDNMIIFSDRGDGFSQGALIKTDDKAINGLVANEDPTHIILNKPVFRIFGDNIRITGLRFQGPSDAINEGERQDAYMKKCIFSPDHENLEIDNCEFYFWPESAIEIGRSSLNDPLVGNYVHHNYIHHNRQHHFGYGTSVYESQVIFSSNLYEANRHDIAGGGGPNCSYEAFCNTILQGGVSHNFDMHAEGAEDSSSNAGRIMYIHHNDFIDVGGVERIGGNNYNIMLRGRPDVICRVENNRFAHRNIADVIRQSSTNPYCGFGNVFVVNNLFEKDSYKGCFAPHNWSQGYDYNKTDFNYNIYDLYSFVNNCGYVSNSFFYGDFDGDSKTDVFKYVYGGYGQSKIYTMPLDELNNVFGQNWQFVQNTGYELSSLRFGYFNNGNTTDMIVQDGNIVYRSDGMTGTWTPMLSTGYPLSEMLVGDFDGNGRTDLLRVTSGSWYISYNSNTNWQYVNYAGFEWDELKVGDFNNDGATDVFVANGTDFLVSYNATSVWQYLNTSGYLTNQLSIGDFNLDGKSDVYRPADRFISVNGVSSWTPADVNNFPLNSVQGYGF